MYIFVCCKNLASRVIPADFWCSWASVRCEGSRGLAPPTGVVLYCSFVEVTHITYSFVGVFGLCTVGYRAGHYAIGRLAAGKLFPAVYAPVTIAQVWCVHNVKCVSVRKSFCDFYLREDGSGAVVGARCVGGALVGLIVVCHTEGVMLCST